MGKHHIDRLKEKTLRTLSIGANRACDNIQPPRHKVRNHISSLHWKRTFVTFQLEGHTRMST